jgi:drug/metabolite transporter (DMT)-like permease
MKPMTKKYSPILLMSLTFYVGMVTMLPFSILENLNFFGPVNYNLMFLDKTAIAGLLYMVLLSSIAAYFMFEWSLTKVTVSDTAILGYMQAVFTLPFAYVLLGELPTTYSLIGGAVIAVGVIIAESSYHAHKKRAKLHKI